ncbi:xanthine dehydrogenase family protein molybdopterin-binding subunit [Parasphingorhabdus sp.]|uniref:xanthine dehydrogenase family protein molybdopterin-binding subunit n=1 Tax=Parasphingorhabdus sp. TaxID=2709688 RepID=UPI0030027E1B
MAAESGTPQTEDPSPGLNRRKFLIGSGALGGLVVAWALWPRSFEPNVAAAENEEIFGAYLKISEAGQVTVIVPQSEMGQGVYTVLPQILADELGADWRTVAVEPAPINPLYGNRLLAEQWAGSMMPVGTEKLADNAPAQWIAQNVAVREPFMVTADSTSIPAFADSFREAGAAARILLTKAAAARWDVAWEACTVENGMVANGAKTLRFGELVRDAVGQSLPDPVPLRPAGAGNLIGQDLPRLDLPSKLDGSANFAGDVRLPDMVFAAIRQGPIGETRLKSFNRAGARKITGFIDVVQGGEWIAAVATNWWAANRALDAMSPIFETNGFLADSEKIDTALREALDEGPGVRFLSRGDTAGVFDKDNSFRARYGAEAAVHAPIETRTAAADFKDGGLELWMATQAPVAAVREAARMLGISRERVTLYPMLSGGSFDRNLDNEIAGQAALIAREIGRPVQLVWSRAEDLMHDHYRAPSRARLDAAMGKAGRVSALQVKIAAPPSAREQMLRLFDGVDNVTALRSTIGEADAKAVAGLEVPYDIPNVTVDHHSAFVGVPTGNWRSNAHSSNVFYLESFIDELAAKAGIEPLSFRMQMMNNQPRLARCLTGVAAMAGWDGGLDGSGQGLACHSMRGGHIAVIASASRGGSGLEVRRISATVDIGRIIHPDIARQQIEGGIVFGLAMALGSATGFQDGLPTARRMRDLSLPRLAEIPPIQIEFIRSEEEPVGYEELGVPAVAPAIANALFSATRVRLRQLPLFGEVS